MHNSDFKCNCFVNTHWKPLFFVYVTLKKKKKTTHSRKYTSLNFEEVVGCIFSSGTVTFTDNKVSESSQCQFSPAVVVHEDHGLVGCRHATGMRCPSFGDLVQPRLDLSVHACRLVVVGAGAVAKMHGVFDWGYNPVCPADVFEGHGDWLPAAPSWFSTVIFLVGATLPRPLRGVGLCEV